MVGVEENHEGNLGNQPSNSEAVLGAFVQQLTDLNNHRSNPASDDLIGRFKKLGPTSFAGTDDASKAEQWVQQLEDIFEVLKCTRMEKRKLAVFQLSGEARNWWELVKTTIGPEAVKAMHWPAFMSRPAEHHVSGPNGRRGRIK